MVILIGGEPHTGETLLAKKLLEQYHFPYTSLGHIKMGLIRGCRDCGFTACSATKQFQKSSGALSEG